MPLLLTGRHGRLSGHSSRSEIAASRPSSFRRDRRLMGRGPFYSSAYFPAGAFKISRSSSRPKRAKRTVRPSAAACSAQGRKAIAVSISAATAGRFLTSTLSSPFFASPCLYIRSRCPAVPAGAGPPHANMSRFGLCGGTIRAWQQQKARRRDAAPEGINKMMRSEAYPAAWLIANRLG
jgi:hypothetical protein